MMLPMFVTTVSALHSVAVIHPIESNIAEKAWVTATASSGGDTAVFAIDGDLDSAWVAGGRAAGQWLMLDFAGAYDNLRKTEVIFADSNVAYRYRIEASSDGAVWDTLVDRSDNTLLSEGAVDLFTRPGIRYLRLTITGATPGATIGIREFRAYNYLRENLINGADLSYMDEFQNRNYYLNRGDADDPGPHVLDVVQDQGMAFVRLRIWNEPRNEWDGRPAATAYCSPERSAVVATWIKARDMQLGIDFHYADSWADPGKQPKPQAWAGLAFDDLVVAMHDFTYDYIRLLVDQGTPPEMVAVGNEIINGFLWGSEMAEMGISLSPAYVRDDPDLYLSQPGGGLLWRYWHSTDPDEQLKWEASWERFSTLVAAGITAVRAASPETRVELHAIVDADRLPKTMEFWTQLLTRIKAKGVEPDSIAISYYPEWHGTLPFLEASLHAMATAFPEYEINIAEHSYPASGQPKPNADEPTTVQGQANMYQHVIRTINDVIDNKGIGMLLWEPQSWEAMFTKYGSGWVNYEANASIEVFHKSFAKHVLEHTVYVTTVRRVAPDLPATVTMLTMGDGSIVSVPVIWATVVPEQVESSGTFTVTGTTTYGAVTAKVTVIGPARAAQRR
jgi:arabinogalactan endo-1,4-beta-galactosidase